MKKGKKALRITGIVLAALIGVMAIASLNGMGYVRKMAVDPVDLSKIADGTYPGSFARGRFSYSVEVVVNDHRIQAVKSTGSAREMNAVTQQIFDRIVQEQSVAVDTVSGASLTTRAVAKAVENALAPR